MIRIWNRKLQKEDTEKVYGDFWVNWIYGSPTGKFMESALLSKKGLSKLYGLYQGSRASRHKIEAFIKEFQIPMQEYDKGPFDSFNDFFIRKFAPGARSFPTKPNQMGAFAEGRYFAYEKVNSEQTFPVKGRHLSAEFVLQNEKWAKVFHDGPVLLARLCPTDYHRFHFPDTGRIVERYTIPGRLHSVNPAALREKSEVFGVNEREVSILETENFGKLAYVEVGALCVGRIVQSALGNVFQRGEEKGYFLFGGSTVIVFGEVGRWCPSSDLLKKTSEKIEVLVQLGDTVAGGPPFER